MAFGVPPNPPIYYIKVLTVSGSILTTGGLTANPLPCTNVTFTDTCFVAGQQQDNSSFAFELLDVNSPTYKYLTPLYAALDYQQRVEIYDSIYMMGGPAFCGVITNFDENSNG